MNIILEIDVTSFRPLIGPISRPVDIVGNGNDVDRIGRFEGTERKAAGKGAALMPAFMIDADQNVVPHAQERLAAQKFPRLIAGGIATVAVAAIAAGYAGGAGTAAEAHLIIVMIILCIAGGGAKPGILCQLIFNREVDALLGAAHFGKRLVHADIAHRWNPAQRYDRAYCWTSHIGRRAKPKNRHSYRQARAPAASACSFQSRAINPHPCAVRSGVPTGPYCQWVRSRPPRYRRRPRYTGCRPRLRPAHNEVFCSRY